MVDESWHRARLIPTSGINGQDEAERRATSALLAVAGVVRPFGRALTKPLGAPAAALDTFIEVSFPLGDAIVIPDGVLQAARAGRTWTALIEVKTGAALLGRQQVENYLDVARDNSFDVVLTISNQISPAPGVHPVDVDRRKLRKVALHHMSWAQVLTTATQQRVHRGVDDPEQAWILEELIRYLEHPRSGALDFSDMGAAWPTVREAVKAGTLRATDKALGDVVSRWEQLLRYSCLRLSRELGTDVRVAFSRKDLADPTSRFVAQADSLAGRGLLVGSLKIPDAVSDLHLVADLRAGQVVVSVDIDAPREGRSATRVGWLVRQLRDAPADLRLDAFTVGARSSTSELLRAVREDHRCLLGPAKKELRSFRVAWSRPLGRKRGLGRNSFIDSVLDTVDEFYRVVVQQLRPWSAKAPQLPDRGERAVESAGLDLAPPPSDLAPRRRPPAPEGQPAVPTVGAAVDERIEPVEPPLVGLTP